MRLSSQRSGGERWAMCMCRHVSRFEFCRDSLAGWIVGGGAPEGSCVCVGACVGLQRHGLKPTG